MQRSKAKGESSVGKVPPAPSRTSGASCSVQCPVVVAAASPQTVLWPWNFGHVSSCSAPTLSFPVF